MVDSAKTAPYPYRVQETIAFPATGSVILGPSPLDLFNSYRDADKQVYRFLMEAGEIGTDTAYIQWALRTPQQTITLAVAPITFIGKTPDVSCFSEYAPPYPVVVHGVDRVFVKIWTDLAILGPGTIPITVTSEFQYVNRDGVPPDRIFQG